MILDTSAILAILFREPELDEALDALDASAYRGVGSATLAEAGIVYGAKTGFGENAVARFVDEFGLDVLPLGPLHWKEAVACYARFGKGRHPARLNLGDCFAYATAYLADEPLLFKGTDFDRTDLAVVRLGG